MPFPQPSVAISLDRVLLATDFTPSATKALDFTKPLARTFSSSVELVHVFDPSSVTSYEDSVLSLYPIDRKRLADDALSTLAASLNASGIKTSILAAEGHHTSSVLLEIAQQQNFDLIVTGTQAKAGLARLIIGSTAEQLIRNADCPVMTIGPNCHIPADGSLLFSRILFATDFSPEAAKATSLALSVAAENASHLYFCYASGIDDEDAETQAILEQELPKRLERIVPEDAFDWCTPEFLVRHGDPARAILSLALEINANLIITGARRSSFLSSHAAPGIIPTILAECTCPVLTIC